MKTLHTTIATILIFISLTIFGNKNHFNTNLPKGKIFQISIDSIELTISQKVVNQYHFLTKVKENNTTKYFFGKYKTSEQAFNEKIKLEKAGCKSVSVVIFNNQHEEDISQHISTNFYSEMLNHLNNNTPKPTSITTKEVDYLLKIKATGAEHYYSLAVKIDSPETIDILLEHMSSAKIKVLDKQKGIYAVGELYDIKEIIQLRKLLVENNLNNAFLMASKVEQTNNKFMINNELAVK